MSRLVSTAWAKSLCLPPTLHTLLSGLISTVQETSVRVSTVSAKAIPQHALLAARRTQPILAHSKARLSPTTPGRGSFAKSSASKLASTTIQSAYKHVDMPSSSLQRLGFGHRHFSTSRPLRAQNDLSEKDLAHIAARRQIEASGDSGFVKPLLFTIGVSAFAWTSAEYWRINKYYIRKEYQRHIRDLYASWGLEDPYPAPYRGRIQPASRENSIVAKYPFLASFTPAQKLLLPMIGICCAITALWHYPVFGYRFMYKNFAHFHESGISRTLLTSAFSHASLAHLGFNMLALWSFADAAYPLLGPEYFMATVVSGAVVASMAQHAYGLMLHSGPALGASGFVFSLVTYVALTYPNNQALFFFVIPVPLLALVKGLVVFDVIGLTGIWSMAFNFHLAHAAHIGGVALGAAVWWLHQLDNRRRMAKALPEEAVGLYNKTYDAVFKR